MDNRHEKRTPLKDVINGSCVNIDTPKEFKFGGGKYQARASFLC